MAYNVWYGTSTIAGYLMPNPFLYIQTVLFQTIQFSISIQSNSIRPIDRTLSGATTPEQSGPGSDTPHSPKLQHFESLMIRLLSVISKCSWRILWPQPTKPTYNVVCVPNYSVPPYWQTPTCLEGAWLIPHP